MDIGKLKSILMMTETELQEHGKDNKNNTLYLYATKEASLPVLLVAHTDTVHDNPPKDLWYDDIDDAYMSWDGLGADDRAGVYAILTLIQKNNCNVPRTLMFGTLKVTNKKIEDLLPVVSDSLLIRRKTEKIAWQA